MTFDEFKKVKLNTFTREVSSRVFLDEKFNVGSAYTVFKIFADNKTEYSSIPIFTGILLTKSKDELRFVTKYHPDPASHLRRYIPEQAFLCVDTDMVCIITLDIDMCVEHHLSIEHGGVIHEQNPWYEIEAEESDQP